MSQHLYDRYGRLYDPNADMIQRPSIARAQLRGSSSFLLNTRGTPAVGSSWQADRPSVFQGFPLTADELLRWLGGGVYPAGVVAANVRGAYLCADVGNQTDSLAIGPALVQAGGALDSRQAVGLGQVASWISKVAIELLGGAERYGDAGNAYADANASIVTTLTVFRINPNTAATETYIVTKKVPGPGGIGWGLSCSSTYLRATGEGALTTQYASIAVDPRDGAWHYAIVSVNDTTKVVTLHSDLGSVTSAAYTGSVTNASSFHLGIAANNNFSGQIAACYVLDAALLAAAGTAFWRHAQVPVPFLHARTNPLVCPIGPSRVACYSGGNVGQAAVGYDAGLVSAALGNPLGTGYVADAGETFEPIGSDNFYGNTAVAGGCARASVDGPSGMRDGCRVTMGGAWAAGVNGYLIAGGVAIAGASNVPWRQDLNYRRATVNTTARHGLYFTGDGGGPEFFTLVTDAASPVDWTRAGGTCTPVGAAHNVFFTQYGAAANLDDCDFGEPAVVKNRATAPLAWRRVGTAAAAVTTTPTVQAANALNYIYSPLRGEVRRTFAGFPGTAGAVLFQFGAAGAAGSMTADYSAGQLRWRGWDSAGALAFTILCGAIGTGKYSLVFQWDTQSPLRTIGGAYVAVVDVNPALPVILGTWLAPWTAQPAAVTPLYLLADAAGANPWRGFHEEA